MRTPRSFTRSFRDFEAKEKKGQWVIEKNGGGKAFDITALILHICCVGKKDPTCMQLFNSPYTNPIVYLSSPAAAGQGTAFVTF